jgi:hypothetical protein
MFIPLRRETDVLYGDSHCLQSCCPTGFRLLLNKFARGCEGRILIREKTTAEWKSINEVGYYTTIPNVVITSMVLYIRGGKKNTL